MIVVRTPLRVSFLGGGTDFPDYYNEHGGVCLSTAIDKYVYVIVKKRLDDQIVLHYTKTETVNQVEDIQHDLIREALKMTGIEKGIEVATMADIPGGTGLGSSSSLTVGLLHALYTLRDITKEKSELAEGACEIEVERLKMTPGKQDQYIAAYGGLRVIAFQKDRITLTHIPRKMRRVMDDHLMLFFTGETRDGCKILTEQNETIPDQLEILHKMVKHCLRGHHLLQENNTKNFGELLDISWNLKKQLHSNISNEEIDGMYSKALRAGANGGKVCGAGGGGFLLLWCEPEEQESVREAMSEYKELLFKCEEKGSTVILK